MVRYSSRKIEALLREATHQRDPELEELCQLTGLLPMTLLTRYRRFLPSERAYPFRPEYDALLGAGKEMLEIAETLGVTTGQVRHYVYASQQQNKLRR